MEAFLITEVLTRNISFAWHLIAMVKSLTFQLISTSNTVA